MSGIDFSGAFPEPNEGGNEQGFADPGDNEENPAIPDAEDEGEKEQEVAEPAGIEETGVKEEEAKEAARQSDEDNARYAAARREAEQKAARAIERARRDAETAALRLVDEKIAATGLENPYTKQPIRSLREFEEWQKRYEAEQSQEELSNIGLDRALLDKLITNHPDVQKARETAKAMQQQEERAKEAAAKAKIDAQLKEITAVDPKIKTLQDLLDAENFDAISEKVKRGYTLTDAYRLANLDKINQETARAAGQAALNRANSKEHLDQMGQRGKGAPTVPAEVLAQYRRINPNASAKEIREHYQRYQKAKKG